MTFEEILDHAIAMLQRRGHLTYGTLKRQFQLDDAALEDLKKTNLLRANAWRSMSGAMSSSGRAPSLPLFRLLPQPAPQTVRRSPTPRLPG